MEAKAHLRYLRMSPRKVRKVADVVRGMTVAHAEAELRARPERAARPLLKLVQSAAANAKQHSDAEEEQMEITTVAVNQGPALKRYRPQARGAVHPIAKHTSHVSVTLAVPDALAKKEAAQEAPPPPVTKASPEEITEGDEDTEKKPTLKRAAKEEKPPPDKKRKGGPRKFFQRKSFGN